MFNFIICYLKFYIVNNFYLYYLYVLVDIQWRIQGGALGVSAPPPPLSNKSSTYINIRFSRLVNVTIWLLIEWFIIDLCDESERKYKLISLY